MATCSTSVAELKGIQSSLDRLTARYRAIRDNINNLNQKDTNTINSGIDQLEEILGQIEDLQAQNDNVWDNKDWDSEECPQGNDLYNGLLNAIPESVSSVQNAINIAQNNLKSLNANKTTVDQNLEEVKVTGKKVPETTTDPSKATTTQDPLAEVTVTGKKVPEPTTDPSKGNPLGAGVAAAGSKLDPKTGAAIPPATGSSKTINGKKEDARSQASVQDAINYALAGDWRVRLSLAPGATYLYRDQENVLLAPLRETDGIIFPYTPSVNVTYVANYDSTAVQHSNYRIFQYQNSAVENITLGCDFTAQDTYEANYILAVIHFFRSVTKMFYGQDENPVLGTPPPLCYLYGLGQYQFNAHPLVVTNFSYSLPTDVDYIRAVLPANPGAEGNTSGQASRGTPNIQQARANSGSTPIGNGGNPQAAKLSQGTGTAQPTYVPTKINIQITASPIVARNDISNDFSLKAYARGDLLLGTTKRAGKGGIW